MSNPPWWTVQQLAAHYGMSVRAIYAAIGSDRLIAHRFGAGGGAIRVADEDRTAWEERCRFASSGTVVRPSFLRRAEADHLIEKHLDL